MQIDAAPVTAAQATRTDWDVLCEAGRIAAEDIDNGRWVLGDLALQTGKLVDDFAREINVPKRRVYEYKQVCSFYDQCVRAQYLRDNPAITYTHFRTAMKRGDVALAYRFLDHCQERLRTTDQAMRLMARIQGRRRVTPPIVTDVPCRLVAVQGRASIVLDVEEAAFRVLLPLFKDGKCQALTLTLKAQETV